MKFIFPIAAWYVLEESPNEGEEDFEMILVKFSDGSFNAGCTELFSIHNLEPAREGIDSDWWKEDQCMVDAMHRDPDWAVPGYPVRGPC